MLEIIRTHVDRIALEGAASIRFRHGPDPGPDGERFFEEFDILSIIDAEARSSPGAEGDGGLAWWLVLDGFFPGDWPSSLRWLGPINEALARELAEQLRGSLGLPRVFEPVTMDALLEDPAAFHDRYIEVEAVWRRGMGRSEIAGAWAQLDLGALERAILAPQGSRRLETIHRFQGRWSKEHRGEGDTAYARAAHFYVHRILPPAFAGSPGELFGEIRARLHDFRQEQGSSGARDRWRDLVALIDSAADPSWLEGQVLPYVEEALEQWEDELRELPPHWALELLQGRSQPKHRLALMGRGYPLSWPFDADVWREELIELYGVEGWFGRDETADEDA